MTTRGPEPEGVALARIEGHWHAFVSFERIGGVIVYDVTDPAAPVFVQYVNPAPAVDKAPEGVLFVKKGGSPTGKPLLIVANEVSGTTTIYEVAT
jgi:hypothetical protein